MMDEALERVLSLADARAEAGAKYLDTHQLSWYCWVRGEIAVGSTKKCPLAAVFGDYHAGVKKLELSDHQTLALGFRGCRSELGYNPSKNFQPYYEALSKAWNRELLSRTALPR